MNEMTNFMLLKEQMKEIKPITMPGTHQRFLEFFKKQHERISLKVLDIGAGHGAFSQKLYDMGYDVYACDLFPELFQFDKIICTQVDITKHFPYNDNTFDLLIAIEVSEHITDHENFFSEAGRILKPGGKLYITTPNILTLKSRIRFLLSGFFLAFNPLQLNNYDGLQHVSSLTLDQYNYIAVRNRFNTAELAIDREQKTSRFWYFLLYPLIWIYPRIKKISKFHNQRKLLLGRLLFLTFRNYK
ncbi:MAG TPA: class I SAM-dependent methyltransferase [Bacteroidales bacterium]|jgi:SAM-dependent methyltransferase|nr:class I SAM-dependent methyltransferase [Bacteroidales bacterium]